MEEEEGRAYTWLSERESGERVKASDEGAGMEGMEIGRADKGEEERIYSSDFALRFIGRARVGVGDGQPRQGPGRGGTLFDWRGGEKGRVMVTRPVF